MSFAADPDKLLEIDSIQKVPSVERLYARASELRGTLVKLAQQRLLKAKRRKLPTARSAASSVIATAVIAANGDRDGNTRFAVENFFVAGAVIDRLSSLGLDATSPEAASAEAAYRTLGRAVGHLITASTSAIASDNKVDASRLKINAAASSDDVQVLRSISE